MKALLLCAGYGSRWKSYNQKHSKMCIPFLNTPTVGYPLKILEDIGIQDVLINTHHHPSQVQEVIKSLKISIQKSFTYEENLLEGIGTLIHNQPFFEGEDNIIYMNGDSVFLCHDFFQSMKSDHEKNNSLITFLVSPSNNFEGIWADENNQVHATKKSNLKNYFFSGFCLIKSECFSLFQKTDRHLFRDFISKHASRCRVHVRDDLKFFEVGDLDSYLQATKRCLKYLFEEPSSKEGSLLKNILSYYHPHFNQFKGDTYYSQTPFQKDPSGYVLCGSHVKGLEHLEVKDFAVIGDNTSIQKALTIESGVLGSGCVINQNLKRSLQLSKS